MQYLSFLIGFCLCLNLSCHAQSESKQAEQVLIKGIVSTTSNQHLQPKPLDNELSRALLDAFINELDPLKEFFTLESLEELGKHEYTIDEALQNGSTDYFNHAIGLRNKQIRLIQQFFKEDVDSAILMDSVEYYNPASSWQHWTSIDATLKIQWEHKITRKYIEYLYHDLASKTASPTASDKTKALAQTKAFYENYFKNLLAEKRPALLERYINCYMKLNDRQSEYLSPTSLAEWEANFSRSFVGVGLSIIIEHSYPVVQKVIIGGPAWQSRVIMKGDVIQAIDNQSTMDMSLTKVLALLKGRKETTVSLNIRKNDGSIHKIEIERAAIAMDRTMAFLIPVANKFPIGYIRLPRFYGGEMTSAYEVKLAIEQLNKRNISSLIFDLRNNQGGSAREAVKIIGYFLKGGVVMQSAYVDGSTKQLEDPDDSQLYNGPLTILINERSGSASELMAGSLQDYGRALVVGNQSFGKGTIQRMVDIETPEVSDENGQLKLTLGSFYTAKGRSTQYHGIKPDVFLPGVYNPSKAGARANKFDLKFKDLPTDNFNSNNHLLGIDFLQNKSSARVAQRSYFQTLNRNLSIAHNRKKNIGCQLNLAAYHQLVLSNQLIDVSEFESPIDNFDIELVSEDLPQATNWQTQLQKDYVLYETVQITKDYFTFSPLK